MRSRSQIVKRPSIDATAENDESDAVIDEDKKAQRAAGVDCRIGVEVGAECDQDGSEQMWWQLHRAAD